MNMKNTLSFILLLICFQVSGQIQTINVGTAANAGNGDNLRAAFQKVNANFTYVDGLLDDNAERIDSLVDAGTVPTWGTIIGTLTDQTDLQTALDAKVPTTRTINSQPLSGDITLTKSNIGLSNVDNTSDASKPVSTATQTALDLKANLASPTLSGTPLAPTAASTTNNTQIATTAFVKSAAPKYFGIACSDLTTALTTGTTKAYFDIPAGFTVTEVKASVLTAQSSGSILTIDINESGTSILSTKLTIDNSETNSATAATAYVLSDTSIANNARISVDIDQVGSTPVGLIVWIIGY